MNQPTLNAPNIHSSQVKCDYDIVIVGGSLVGAALACALKTQALRIAIVEAKELQPKPSPQNTLRSDPRALVLTPMSQKILDTLGVWSTLTDHITPISQVHVSHAKSMAMTRFKAEKQNVPALGYVAPMAALQQSLQSACGAGTSHDHTNNDSAPHWYCPARVKHIDMIDDYTQLTLQLENNKEKTLAARLVIAADGQHSSVRKFLQIETKNYDYQQKALVASIELTRPHANIAYERFTHNAAIAMIPLSGNSCKLIWCASDDNIETMLNYSDDEFLEHLQKTFGYRLGRFTAIGKRFTYPLQLQIANQHYYQRAILTGNAAHTIHPIAAQGYNLALNNVALLAEMIVDAYKRDGLHDVSWLSDYQKQCEAQQSKIIRFTDTLARHIVNEKRSLSLLRNGFVMAIEHINPIKKLFIDKIIKRSGKTPKLACGIPL